jgi:Golgi nucleoside diphosphatase
LIDLLACLWLCLFQSLLNSNRTAGLIDLGGASAELSFVPQVFNETQQILYPHYYSDVSWMNRTTSVYTKSYLGLGINEARNQYRTVLINRYLETNSEPGMCENVVGLVGWSCWLVICVTYGD